MKYIANGNWIIPCIPRRGFKSVLDAVFEASSGITKNLPRYPEPTELSDAIVAGRKLDLSGTASCPIYDCLRRNVDATFRRIWHYFDQIVVEGIAPQWLAQEITRTDATHFPRIMVRIRAGGRRSCVLHRAKHIRSAWSELRTDSCASRCRRPR